MPIASGITEDSSKHEVYFDIIEPDWKSTYGMVGLKEHIDYKKSYCVSDFERDYHAFKGNAWACQYTEIKQRFLKPSIKNPGL